MNPRCFAILARRAALFLLLLACGGILAGPSVAQDKAAKKGAEPAKKAGETPAKAAPAKAAPAPEVDDENEGHRGKVIKPDETQKRNSSRVMTGILPSGKFGSGDQELLDTFFNTYFLAQWTLPENRSSLPILRGKLRNSFRTAKGGPVYEHLNAVVMEFMNKIARDKEFDPVLRVNAALEIGELNAAEPARPSDPAAPAPEAVDVLLGLMDESGSEAVSAAAMVGLVRQARFGLNDNLRPKVTTRMLDLLGDAASRSSPGQVWLRGESAEALGLIGLVGSDGNVARKLADVVGDSKSPLSVRCAAASAVGQLEYQGAGGSVNVPRLVTALAQLTLDACEAEKPLASRHRLKPRLLAITQGLRGTDDRHTGIAPLATTETLRGQVTTLFGVIKALMDCTDDEQLLEKIKENRAKLQGLVKKTAE